MKSIKLMKGFMAATGSALLGLMLATAASATTEPVTAQVEFVAAVQITETNALQYGLLDVTMLNLETVVIAVDNTVTDANNNVQGGTQASAKFDVIAANGKTLVIQVQNVNTPAGSGYSLGTWRCDYNAASEGDCVTGITPSAGAGAQEVRVGATLTGDGTATAGIKNSTFDLVVVYQ
jgi:hypothetical protein